MKQGSERKYNLGNGRKKPSFGHIDGQFGKVDKNKSQTQALYIFLIIKEIVYILPIKKEDRG